MVKNNGIPPDGMIRFLFSPSVPLSGQCLQKSIASNEVLLSVDNLRFMHGALQDVTSCVQWWEKFKRHLWFC